MQGPKSGLLKGPNPPGGTGVRVFHKLPFLTRQLWQSRGCHFAGRDWMTFRCSELSGAGVDWLEIIYPQKSHMGDPKIIISANNCKILRT